MFIHVFHQLSVDKWIWLDWGAVWSHPSSSPCHGRPWFAKRPGIRTPWPTSAVPEQTPSTALGSYRNLLRRSKNPRSFRFLTFFDGFRHAGSLSHGVNKIFRTGRCHMAALIALISSNHFKSTTITLASRIAFKKTNWPQLLKNIG